MRSADRVDLVLRDVTLPDLEHSDCGAAAGHRVDVAVRDGRVVAVESAAALTGTVEYDGRGAALLPGLHDHHLHLLATAALVDSVDCSDIRTLDELGTRLRAAVPRVGWLRAVGHHEGRAGRLSRDVLDRLLGADRAATPARVRDHTGALWILNTAGLELLGDLPLTADVERDADGRPTGRFWRFDTELGARLGRVSPDLSALGAELARLGITGVTDATPGLARDSVNLLHEARLSGRLPQRLVLLGVPDDAELPATVAAGPAKIHLRDHDLPTVETLASAIAAHHRNDRPVAVHCLGLDALVLTLAALAIVGPVPGDRLEHASVVPPTLLPELRDAGVRVVTQPAFLTVRGDDFLRDVEATEREWLWPWAGVAAAGVPVCGASDAPHGPVSPWQVVAAAAARRTPSGRVVGPHERIPPAQALRGYLTSPELPGGPVRTVVPGTPADLVLLRSGLDEALERIPDNPVRLTVAAGRTIYDAVADGLV